MKFVLNQPAELEESLTCEFKEIKTNVTSIIGKTVDEYVVAFLNEIGGSIFWGIRDVDRVVTGFPVTQKTRDELRQIIGQKVASIAPSIPATTVTTSFNAVYDDCGQIVRDTCVLSVTVDKPAAARLYLTGGGEAFRKTLGGKIKLSGAELFLALANSLKDRAPDASPDSVLSKFPGVYRRACAVQPLITGKRVLWIDDHPSNNFYERLALAQMGISVDIATTSKEALTSLQHLPPDLILSDIARGTDFDAGVKFLNLLRSSGIEIPIVFYVGQVDSRMNVPRGAFAITDRPDEILHLALDALERQSK